MLAKSFSQSSLSAHVESLVMVFSPDRSGNRFNAIPSNTPSALSNSDIYDYDPYSPLSANPIPKAIMIYNRTREAPVKYVAVPS